MDVTELINYTQPIYVRREDHDSRQKTVQEIINRVNSKEDWSQVSDINVQFIWYLFCMLIYNHNL